MTLSDANYPKPPHFYQQHCAQRKPPVFNLLRVRFWGFWPRRGDTVTLHRWGWNLAWYSAARWSRRNSPSVHHPTTLSACIFATKACINNRKKLLLLFNNFFPIVDTCLGCKDTGRESLFNNSNTSCPCPHNMVNFGPLAAEIGSGVWGTPANFNGSCVLC